jgi:hypothetical protein
LLEPQKTDPAAATLAAAPGQKSTKPKRTATPQTAKSKQTAAGRSPAVAAGATTTKPLSAVAAAAQVLRETGQALSCPELIAAMAAKGYWTSPRGQTPSATLYAALTREIQHKGPSARFCKAERGKFALRTGA